VSVDSNGIEGASESSGPAISADGRFVAFTSFAPNLVTNDTNGASDIFVRDRLTGTTERVSVNSVGGQANGASSFCSISGNGNCVAFECSASNLVVGDTNGRVDVFVRDRLTGMTERASVSTSGAEGDSDSFYPSISADGRCVAFESDASNLVPATTTPWIDIFVRDRQTRTTERASSSTAGAEENFDSYGASISADGRCVAFASGASNLVAADTNNKADAFVRDRGPQDCNGNGVADDQDIQSGTSADCNANGVPDECDMPTMDCDGNAQIDSCEIASNPALDFDHNGTLDRCQDAGTPYCFGDGSGHACPCDPGQIGATGHGCANSSGEGAILSATGVASVTGDDLQLHVANMPNPSSVLFFQGTVQQGSGQGSFNGDGLLCVNGPGGNLIRLGIHAGQPGTSSYGAGIGNDPLISVRGLIPAIGGTRYYQAWFRDSTAFCTSANFNFSNGLAIVWTP
jgi:hypothetical protein